MFWANEYLITTYLSLPEHTTNFGFPAQKLWILNLANLAVHPAIAVTP